MGAGFPKGSCSFQTATELLGKSQTQKQAPEAVQEGEQEPPGGDCDLQDDNRSESFPGCREETPGGSALCERPSPEKGTKGSFQGSAVVKPRANKKQQLLAAAAHKDSQNITRFLCQRTESPPLPTSVLRSEGAGPSCGGMQRSSEVLEEEDGAQRHLSASLQTECFREGPR